MSMSPATTARSTSRWRRLGGSPTSSNSASCSAATPLTRKESCGAHFREEYQTPDGEAERNDDDYCHVAAWEFTGEDSPPIRNVEPLVFEKVALQTRSYK